MIVTDAIRGINEPASRALLVEWRALGYTLSNGRDHGVTLSGRYFVPGPVEIDAEVAAAMLRPMMGHRGPEARELVARCSRDCRRSSAPRAR